MLVKSVDVVVVLLLAVRLLLFLGHVLRLCVCSMLLSLQWLLRYLNLILCLCSSLLLRRDSRLNTSLGSPRPSPQVSAALPQRGTGSSSPRGFSADTSTGASPQRDNNGWGSSSDGDDRYSSRRIPTPWVSSSSQPPPLLDDRVPATPPVSLPPGFQSRPASDADSSRTGFSPSRPSLAAPR